MEDEDTETLRNEFGDHTYHKPAHEIIEVAKNPDKCINFPLSEKLTQAFPRDVDVALTLAGFVILASSQIYARKVDYLSQEAFGMAQNFRTVLQQVVEAQIEQEIQENQPAKRSRTKKFNIQENYNLFDRKFEEKPLKIMREEDILEPLSRPKTSNKIQALKEFFDKHRITATKKTKLVLPKRFALSSDNECLTMAGSSSKNNDGSREDHFYDYDGEEIVGSRKDFAVYSYCIDSTTGQLMYDLNFKKFLDPRQQFERDSGDLPDMLRMGEGDFNFDVDFRDFGEDIVDMAALNSTEKELDSQRELGDVTMENLSAIETSGVITGESSGQDPSVSLNTPENSAVDQNSTAPDQISGELTENSLKSPETSENTLESPETSGNTLESPENSLNQESGNLESLQQPEESSTTLDLTGKEIMIPPDVEDNELAAMPELTDQQIKSLSAQGPSVSLTDLRCITPGIMDEIPINGTIDMTKFRSSLLAIKERIINNEQEFTLSEDYFISRMENILQIPIKYVTKHKIFDLPEEYDYLKKRKREQAKKTCGPEPKVMKMTGESEIIDTTPVNPEDPQNPANPNPESPDDPNSPEKKKPSRENRTSADSGICENSENPFATPLDTEHSDADDGYDEEIEEYEKTEAQQKQIKDMQELAEKVNSWHEYLKPILRKSWERADFQVKEYGGKIIQKIDENEGKLKLNEVMVKGEMARYFLATLELINKNNISIEVESTPDQPTKPEDVELTLLSKEMHHEQIDHEMSENLRDTRRVQEEYDPVPEKPSKKRPKKIATSTPIPKKSRIEIRPVSPPRKRIASPQPLLVQSPIKKSRFFEQRPSLTESVYSSQSSGYYSQVSMARSMSQASDYFSDTGFSVESMNVAGTSKSFQNCRIAAQNNSLMPTVPVYIPATAQR